MGPDGGAHRCLHRTLSQGQIYCRRAHHPTQIHWGGENQPFTSEKFDLIHYRMLAYLQGKEIFVQDCHAGADRNLQMNVRLITATAWQSLFARNMFLAPVDPANPNTSARISPLSCAPGFHAVPELDGTNSEAFIMVNFGQTPGPHRWHLICRGDQEIGLHHLELLPASKRSAFHALCRQPGANGDTALFFGLSGTGKTSPLSRPGAQTYRR